MMNDIMTPTPLANAVISNFTLIGFYISGWYNVDFSAADHYT